MLCVEEIPLSTLSRDTRYNFFEFSTRRNIRDFPVYHKNENNKTNKIHAFFY